MQAHRPGGDAITFEAEGHDISLHGFALRQSQFLHRDTECTVWLPRLDGGEPVEVHARVAWCGFVGGQTHVCGFRAAETLPLERLADRATWTRQIFDVRWNSASVSAEVLCLSPSEAEQDMVGMTLVGSGIKPLGAGGIVEARARLKAEHPDVIIISDDPTSGTGAFCPAAAARGVREAGFCGLLAVLAVRRPEDPVMDDVAVFLHKPWNPDHLRDVMLEALADAGLAGIPDGLPSMVDVSKPKAAQAVEHYLRILRRYPGEMRDALAYRDAEAILTLATSLKATGLGFGYPLLSEAADQVLRAVGVDGLERSRGAIALLQHVLRKVLAAAPAEVQPEAPVATKAA